VGQARAFTTVALLILSKERDGNLLVVPSDMQELEKTPPFI